MKKIIKSRIFSFFLGAIIFGFFGVVYAENFLARDVSYEPKDDNFEVDNVSDALDYLYENVNLKFNQAQYSVSVGPGNSKTNSITLTKGKYILLIVDGFSAGTPTSIASSYSVNSKNITCSTASNCIIKKLSGYASRAQATAKENDSQYHYVLQDVCSFFVEVLSENETISLTRNSGIASQYANRVPIYVGFSAIPLSNNN
ncbi:MAG: hypothetical protein IJ572_00540 [Bacilli bacterium]|nr:hypothetical protein [Bacilli bacterium]